jgi:hypothetical protein
MFAGASYTPREYFVLTDAGKPVYIRYAMSYTHRRRMQTFYTSRPGGADQDGMASTIGIMQALISVFLDDNDKLRCINAGKTRITFLLRPPLYYACVSSWGEPESVVCAHFHEFINVMLKGRSPVLPSCETRHERISNTFTSKFSASLLVHNSNESSNDGPTSISGAF